jgi:hypothetical protein
VVAFRASTGHEPATCSLRQAAHSRSRLFAAALEGDQPAFEALWCLAEDVDSSPADPSETRRALRVLEERSSEYIELDHQRQRVAAQAYADQLRARYRDEQASRTARRPDALPARRGSARRAFG